MPKDPKQVPDWIDELFREHLPERSKARAHGVDLWELREAGFRSSADFYYAARLLADGHTLDEARARLKEARTTLNPRQWTYVAERAYNPPRFLCTGCDRLLDIERLYGGPSDQDPDAPVCASCIDESFAEHG